MAVPTNTVDIVVIHESYGTPKNYNKAHAYTTRLTYTTGDLTKVEEIMLDGAVEYLRKATDLTYDVVGNLNTVTEKIYDVNGVTIEIQFTDTLTYDVDGNLDEIVRTVI